MVYVIESPGALDFLEERKEGEILSKALSLSGIKSRYFQIVNKQTLDISFQQVGEEIRNSENPLTTLPFIHVSAHGNQDGFELTSEEFITWAEFSTLLIQLNKNIGYIDLSKKLRISKIVLCMSVCEGLNVKRIGVLRPKPFQAIIGNSRPIYWNDALTAFIIFYHNAIVKKVPTREAVRRMNLGSGIDIDFDLEVDQEILNSK
jgi:hypothetical protein